MCPFIMLTAKGECRTGCVASAWAWTIMWLSPSVLRSWSPAPAILARSRRALPETHPALIVRGDIVIDLAERRAMRGGQPVRLTPTEFRLLAALAEQPGTHARSQGSPDKGLGERVRRRRRKCKALHLLPASET